MSNSHQLTRNKSYNYWLMDKTKGAEGNLHNKREAAKSSFSAILTANNLHFYVARAKQESRQVGQSESAASCRSEETWGALFTTPLKKTFRAIWKVCVVHDKAPSATDDKRQTSLAKNSKGADGRLADALEGLSNEPNDDGSV